MSAQAQDLTIRKSIAVDVPVERAFEVFTQEIGRWWRPNPLFAFTPPPGATVTQPTRKEAGAGQPPAARSGGPKVVGQGWDSVLVAPLPAQPPPTPGQNLDPLGVARRVGTPVSGPWGSGWLVTTKVASAIVTS